MRSINLKSTGQLLADLLFLELLFHLGQQILVARVAGLRLMLVLLVLLFGCSSCVVVNLNNLHIGLALPNNFQAIFVRLLLAKYILLGLMINARRASTMMLPIRRFLLDKLLMNIDLKMLVTAPWVRGGFAGFCLCHRHLR